VVLRVFNPVGPGAPESILPGRLVGELRRAASGGDVVLGALDAVRDFVDARDVADAVIASALAPALPAAVINIGSGTGVPVRTLVRELVAISGYDGPVTEQAAPDRSGSGRASWQQADIGRARRDLDWQPRRSLAASVADLWEDCCAPAPG
jgi:NDP-hexose 4-ketoreductase